MQRILSACWLLAIAGCGAVSADRFPNQVLGADGQPILLDDLEAIADETGLSDEERREQFRELGIQDEKLIEVLLRL